MKNKLDKINLDGIMVVLLGFFFFSSGWVDSIMLVGDKG
jgi:hypothetical protein